MNPIFETLKQYKFPTRAGPSKSTGEKARRKLIIDDIKQLTNWDDTKVARKLWQRFSYPVYIPTEWLEGWKDTLIVHSGVPYLRSMKLLELIKESQRPK